MKTWFTTSDSLSEIWKTEDWKITEYLIFPNRKAYIEAKKHFIISSNETRKALFEEYWKVENIILQNYNNHE